MLRLRVTMDRQPRTKNGQPPHSTTGADSRSCVHRLAVGFSPAANVGATISTVASPKIGSVSARLTQKRRVMPTSSALGPSSAAVTSRGSSAMPHFGQLPGPTCRTSGCIGHV